MAGKAKRKTAKNAATPDGLLFPARLVPLEVLGCWLAGSWEDGKYGHFTYNGTEVVFHHRENGGQPAWENKVGRLPPGWDAAEIFHNDSGDSGWFVGHEQDIGYAKLLNAECDAREDALGAMIHSKE
jgi:hypothetical protein